MTLSAMAKEISNELCESAYINNKKSSLVIMPIHSISQKAENLELEEEAFVELAVALNSCFAIP